MLFPDGVFVDKKEKKKVLYFNHFHVSLAHARSSVLKAPAQQHGIQVVGELTSCTGCSMTEKVCASNPHLTTSRAAAPMSMVHIDTAELFQETL